MKQARKPAIRKAEIEKAIFESVEGEQRRIGQDLHDGLCQQLTGIALIAKALAQKLSVKMPDAAAEASEIAELISQSIDQTRDLARGLSPVEIEVAGLVPALQKFADTIEHLYNISCVFQQDEKNKFQGPYEPLLANHLYRIVQEAVTNAIKHGKARHVTIKLDVQGECGRLTVRDDGVGFDAKEDEKGLGLRGMQYRGRMIGSRLKVSSGENGGILVTCAFPLHGKYFSKYEKN